MLLGPGVWRAAQISPPKLHVTNHVLDGGLCHTGAMSKALTVVDAASQAASAAKEAASRAGVEIARLEDIEAIGEATDLCNGIWAGPDQPVIASPALRGLSHSGNYVYAAYSRTGMVGVLVGFLGYRRGLVELHSHILGVSPRMQGKSVGFALKEHQRAWALRRAISTVTWTYDPLVRRNAYFNIAKLGACVTDYYTSFYGEMNDAINGSDETDRVFVEWQLESERATEASVGRAILLDQGLLERSGAKVALAVGDGQAPREKSASGDTLVVCVPEDIVELRRRDEALARRWRLAVRSVLGDALADGYAIVGMTRSAYVLKASRS